MCGFRVMSEQCATCIYRPDSPLDLVKLEEAIADPYGGFKRHRECHHKAEDGGNACCRVFWNRHRNEFQAGQIAQPEPDRKCELCGIVAETRPYGPGGIRICYGCGEKDREGTTKRMHEAILGEPTVAVDRN